MEGFLSTGENDYIMLCAHNYLNIGAQSDGPSLHLDEAFKFCSTHHSLTFANHLLNGKTEGRFQNKFEVQDLEVFII